MNKIVYLKDDFLFEKNKKYLEQTFDFSTNV